MELSVQRQERYSRGELLLRSIFGAIYIGIPHLFLLFFIQLWSGVLAFVTFWAILFTGKYPDNMFDYQVKALRWNLRVTASMSNLVDGYPAFGMSGESEAVKLEIQKPESVSRGSVLLRTLLGAIYVVIPHGIVLGFRLIGTAVLSFLAFWVVLFTGEYPQRWHDFNVGTLRWQYRVNAYMLYLTGAYPKFSGAPD